MKQLLLLVAFTLVGCIPISYKAIFFEPYYQKSIKDAVKVTRNTENIPAISELLAGFSKMEITPEPGIQLAGFGSRRSEPSTGVNDKLYTRSMALFDGSDLVVVVSADILAITNEIFEAAYQKIIKELSLSRANLMITATHTHSGPGGLSRKFLEKLASGKFNSEYFDRITQAMASAAIDSVKKLSKADIAFGTADGEKFIRNRMVKGERVNTLVRFIAARGSQQKVMGHLVNFSAHPTVIKSKHTLVSGDYPGFISSTLEETGEAIGIFTAGSVGDASPFASGEDDFQKAENMGTELASMVKKATPGLDYKGKVDVQSIKTDFILPPSQLRLPLGFRLPSVLGNRLLDNMSTIQVVKIGRTLLVGVPCDISSGVGVDIINHAKSKGFDAIIISFANDYIGYVIEEKFFSTSSYEAKLSLNGPYMGSYIKDLSYSIIDNLAGGGEF